MNPGLRSLWGPALCCVLACHPPFVRAAESFDVLIRNAMIYDGSGSAPFKGAVALRGEQIAYVGADGVHTAAEVIDAGGKALAPGFINMLAHPEESILVDGRALSDLVQGVTLEVMGEFSMGPVNEAMKRAIAAAQSVPYELSWNSLGEYLDTVGKRSIAPNIASYVGAGNVRIQVLGEGDVEPDNAQLEQMRALVRQAMEEGAVGVTTMLIYNPNTYAKTAELAALAGEAARCGGIYSAHMRSEGARLLEAVQETIEISRASGAPAEIYHLKAAGRDNWAKLDQVVRTIESARAAGIRITADMYLSTAGASGLDAAMPNWVQEGGYAAWVARLKDPATRARVIAEMRAPAVGWENALGMAGADGTLLLGFKNPALRSLIGKSLADVAKVRGVSPQDAAIDLVVEDGSRVELAYFMISEDNVRRQVALPWVSFGSDADAPAPEGVFLQQSRHPRTYGNFARLLAKYVREERRLPLEEAIRKLTSLPAATLALDRRGLLAAGYFADLVLFDPQTIQDHATFEQPHRLATGVSDVWVNGIRALRGGRATGAASGRIVRGRAWTGSGGGGCKASAADWRWSR